MDGETLLALTGFALAASWTPGPNNMMLASSGATFGWRRSVPHAMGVVLGFALMLFLIAVGLGEVFQRSATFRAALSWIGLAVMLWLSWRIAMSGPAESGSRARPLNFVEAVGFQWINPKAWVMAIGVGATYVEGASPTREAAIAALVFAAAGLSSTQGWLVFGTAIGGLLGTGGKLRAFNVAMGLLLALSAVWLVAADGV